MKILRLFDSLKFVRVMFVALVATFAFFVAPAHAATLPAGYTELEYIEGTGTQRIDTGIKITSNDIIETEFKNTSSTRNGSLYGVFAAGNSSAFYANDTYYGYNVVNGKVDTNVSVDTTWHNVIHNFVDGTLKLDNTTVEFAPFSFANNVNSHLFARYYNGTYGYYFSGYVKKHKITRNGVVIINLIPARRDNDGVVGMYDLADSNPETAFHTNAGTGNFIAGEYKIKIATTHYNETKFAPVETDLDAAVAVVDTVVSQTMTQAQQIDDIANNKQTRPEDGCSAKYCLLVEDEQGVPHWYPIAGVNGVAHNLPSGYTELQYIESTGTQYIDTGIIPTNRTSISAKATVLNLNSGPSFFGSLSGNPLVGLLLGTNSTGSGSLFVNKTTDALNVQITANSIYEINLSGTTLSIQKSGEQAQTFTTTPIVETAGNIYMIGRNEDGVVKRLGAFKYYYMKIYENGVLVRDFVPAKNSNNVIGMYDMVSGQFFTNAGTGDFTAGPDM